MQLCYAFKIKLQIHFKKVYERKVKKMVILKYQLTSLKTLFKLLNGHKFNNDNSRKIKICF